MATMAFKVGRPLRLDQDMIEHLCSFVPGNHSVLQVSRLSGIPQSTLITWLDLGKIDQEKSIDSIYAQFSSKFNAAIGNEVRKLLAEMHAIGNYQSTSWMLEKCYPEEYGNEAPQMKEFRELFKIVTEIKGANNGTEKAQPKTGSVETEETKV